MRRLLAIALTIVLTTLGLGSLASPAAFAIGASSADLFDENVPAPTDGSIWSVAQTDSGYLIGGTFTIDTPKSRLFKVELDGDPDTAFNANLPTLSETASPNVGVYTVVWDGTGYLVGGSFVTGAPKPRLFRIKADGSPDTAFNAKLPTLSDGEVISIAWDGSGYLIGGSFTSGAPSPRLFRIDQTGAADTAFNQALSAPTEDAVWSIAYDGSGYLIGGGFVDPAPRLFRIGSSGALDETFNDRLPALDDGSVYSIAWDGSTGYLIGGSFTSGPPKDRLFKLKANGSADAAFNSFLSAPDGAVRTVSWDGNGFVVGGEFVAGAPKPRLFRVKNNGANDPQFNDNAPTLAAGAVLTVVHDNTGWVVGGVFAAGAPRPRIFRISAGTAAGRLTFANTAFGNVAARSSRTLTVSVKNDGDTALTLTGVKLPDSATAIQRDASNPGTCSSSSPLAAGATCTVRLVWSPQSATDLNVELGIDYLDPGNNNAAAKSATVVTGTAIPDQGGALTFVNTTFGDKPVNLLHPQTVSVQNKSSGDLTLTSAPAVSGTAMSTDDTASSGSCIRLYQQDEPLQAGGTCTVVAVWQPVTEGALSGALLALTYEDAQQTPGSQSAQLTGTAIPGRSVAPRPGTGNLPSALQGQCPNGSCAGVTLAPNTNLSNTNLSGLNLAGATCNNCNLTGITATGANLAGFQAPNSNWTGANIAGSNNAGANYAGGNFTGVNGAGSNFSNAQLSVPLGKAAGARAFRGTVANFSRANFAGADFRGAKARGVLFTGAKLKGAKFGGAKLAHANFRTAKLTKANLTRADLTHSALWKADLTRATLTKARFVRADCRAAKFVGAKVAGAKFSKADLRKSRGLPKSKLGQARLT